MTPDTPKEAVEESKDRFERLETLVRRASRVAGRVDAVETQLANARGGMEAETADAVAALCEGIRSDVETLDGVASEFLDAEADSRALYSMTSVFTSDLSEVAAHLPEGGELGQDVEPLAETFDEVCGLFERELELLQVAIHLEAGTGKPSVDGDVELTSEAVVSRVEELQAERKSVSAQLDDETGMAGVELTETAFFGE
ncbi:hypothetical protein [Halorubellus litoreus]|uniref:Chemotaxis protein n=1 Tax=Halorubellus litoreus TaxID=755308 RepID=A0ABD5VK28_9EURY